MECVDCQLLFCYRGDQEGFPGCPMEDRTLFDQSIELLKSQENLAFYQTSTRIEAKGYGRWPRACEIIQFCKDMEYQSIGIAFCIGLRREAAIFNQLLKRAGFSTVTALCKSGGVPKEAVGLENKEKIRPNTTEVICNPIAQALRLNKSKTDLNVVIGLCVGHDSLFYKYSEAPVTTLVTKDRRLGHNPAAALYLSESGYLKEAFDEVLGETADEDSR
ncbi:MAG TPA: DUF1847 domain-containing protein [Clostridia bacterium]|nr:DUF1847 domain-containing protein [Clostridia bacterium]